MHAQTTAAPTRGLARLDAAIVLQIVLLSVISLAGWYSPGFPGVDQFVRPWVPYNQPSGPHARLLAMLCALAWSGSSRKSEPRLW